MVVVERRYKALNNAKTMYYDCVERRVFKDDDYTLVQEFISKEGDYKYIKL